MKAVSLVAVSLMLSFCVSCTSTPKEVATEDNTFLDIDNTFSELEAMNQETAWVFEEEGVPYGDMVRNKDVVKPQKKKK